MSKSPSRQGAGLRRLGFALALTGAATPVRAAPAPADEPPTYYVRAIGQVSPAHLRFACETIRQVFPVRCRVLRTHPLPADALDATRHQYEAGRLVEGLFRDLPEDALGLVGVTNADLYERGRSPFVFGLAHLVDHVAVVSLARYRGAWWGAAEDEARFRARFHKVLIHEVGHTLGRSHCPHRACAMRDDRTLEDLDASPAGFCRTCAAELRRAGERRPGSAPWHYARGHSHLNRGQFAQAVFHFERAVAGDPLDPRHFNDLGVACLRRGDGAQALWAFREAARLDPYFPNARYNQGLVFLGAGDPRAAARAFEAALAADPGWALAHRQLGYLLLEVDGDSERAYEHFGQYLATHGDDPSVREQMRLIKGGGDSAPGP